MTTGSRPLSTAAVSILVISLKEHALSRNSRMLATSTDTGYSVTVLKCLGCVRIYLEATSSTLISAAALWLVSK